jgi:hypothetical protein
MDRYTVIYIKNHAARQNIKNILDTSAKKGDIYGTYTINDVSINIKNNRLVAKDLLKENIKDFTYYINSIGIYANPHEYIGKKMLNSTEYTCIVENIKNNKYFIHSNRMQTDPDLLMFTNPATIGSSYGIIKKEYILIFSNRLSLIDTICDSIFHIRYNLYENNISHIVLCI